MEQHFLTDPDQIIVCKNGHEIMVMSRFSSDLNMVTRFIEGNENAFLLPVVSPLEAWQNGRLWAQSWDNNAPFMTGLHNTIGANHGSPFAFAVKMLRHWLFEGDIGSVFTDDAGNKFVLTSIDSRSVLSLHSDVPEPGKPFADKICGDLHGPRGTIKPETVTRTMVDPERGKQLCPHYRYNAVEFYADGKLLADGIYSLCSKAELKYDIDLILVDDWLNKLKSSPGRYISPVSPELQGAINSKVTTTFRPRCSRTVDCDLTFLQDFNEHIRTGVLQFYTEVPFSTQERLIPGIKKFTLDGMEIDLGKGFLFPDNFNSSKFLTRSDCISQQRLVDRSIDFFGSGKREIGLVLGYSLTRGITARGNEAERSNLMLHLAKTKKNYPCAFEKDSVRAGEKFKICSYQHSFEPDDSGVSCYQLEMEDGYFLYLDFPEKCEKYTVALPSFTAGKTFTVLDQVNSILLNSSNNRIPECSTLEIAASDCGSLVLKISLND